MTAHISAFVREHPILSGWAGSVSSFLAAAVNQLEQINAALSMVSLVIGIGLALMSAPPTIEKFLDWRRRQRRKRERQKNRTDGTDGTYEDEADDGEE